MAYKSIEKKRAYDRAYNATHKEKIKRQQKEYYQKNKPITPQEPQVPKEENTPKQSSKDELYSYALQLVNKDRADYGLNPVTLGNNPKNIFANCIYDHNFEGAKEMYNRI